MFDRKQISRNWKCSIVLHNLYQLDIGYSVYKCLMSHNSSSTLLYYGAE